MTHPPQKDVISRAHESPANPGSRAVTPPSEDNIDGFAAASGRPALSLVCTTVGRPDALRRLATSVAESEMAERIEFVLVDQSAGQSCAQLLRTLDLPGPVHVTTSGRGASAGRNAGTPLATAPIVGYPDDNCWYPPRTLRTVVEILAEHPEWAGVGGIQITEDGRPSMLRWLDRSAVISRRNFMHTSICSTVFLRRSALPSAAPFDESIGTGSAGRRGAGEESDLLLRVIAAGHTLFYRPDLHIYQDDHRDEPTAEFIEKMRKYGVGNGHLWRRHRLAPHRLAYYSARKLVGAAVHAARREPVLARADLAFLTGQLRGWLGTES
ncbi:glycosyltransferase family 2 protein [Mycobacterium sp. GA-2829]|uniref:glycosyltransferase family 2 protein n=1 Tax=Mycobacterium sp. GA-2829 TaxID=1772283 RepID=UPI001E5F2EB7|nr:glycosyltransferase [Mycobacterium sp. GA-2829]